MGHSKTDNSLRMCNTTLSLDKALEFVGDNSFYQKNLMRILSFSWCVFSFMSMGLPFLFKEPVFLCAASDSDTSGSANSQISPDKLVVCSYQQACKASYSEIDKINSVDSASLDFQLYCDRTYLIGLSESAFFFGNALSGLIFPPLSNIKGRKTALVLSLLLASISMILCGFTTNIYQFIAALFCGGLSLSGFEAISLVYVSEVSAEKFRNYSTIFLGCAWAAAQILHGIITKFITSWRYQCIILKGIPFLIAFVLAQLYFLETPRFLAAQGNFEDARQVLDKICQKNKRPRFQYKLEGEEEEDSNRHQGSALRSTHGYIDLFRYKSLRSLTIILVILWSFRYMIYYGQQYSLSSLGEEMSSNQTYTALSEILAILMSAPIKTRMKRITSLFWFALMTTICSVSLIFLSIPETCYLDQYSCYQKVLVVISAIGIRFGVAVFGGVLMTFTSECYPTVVRSLGYGICIASGKILIIFVPMMVVFFQGYNLQPLAFFGFLGFGAAILCRFLKETAGQEMAEYIQEDVILDRPLVEMDQMQNNAGQQYPNSFKN